MTISFTDNSFNLIEHEQCNAAGEGGSSSLQKLYSSGHGCICDWIQGASIASSFVLTEL